MVELVEMRDFGKCLKYLVPGAGVEPERGKKRHSKSKT